MLVMFMVAFFGWWYGKGWKQVISSISPRLNGIIRAFSVKQLTRTLFEPWRRIITYPGNSLAEKFQAWGDNLFSRFIGFFVRIFVLIAALVSLIVVAILTIVEIVIWPLLPPAVVGLIIVGLIV